MVIASFTVVCEKPDCFDEYYAEVEEEMRTRHWWRAFGFFGLTISRLGMYSQRSAGVCSHPSVGKPDGFDHR